MCEIAAGEILANIEFLLPFLSTISTEVSQWKGKDEMIEQHISLLFYLIGKHTLSSFSIESLHTVCLILCSYLEIDPYHSVIVALLLLVCSWIVRILKPF